MLLIKSNLGSLAHKCWNRKIKEPLFPLQAGNGNGIEFQANSHAAQSCSTEGFFEQTFETLTL